MEGEDSGMARALCLLCLYIFMLLIFIFVFNLCPFRILPQPFGALVACISCDCSKTMTYRMCFGRIRTTSTLTENDLSQKVEFDGRVLSR